MLVRACGQRLSAGCFWAVGKRGLETILAEFYHGAISGMPRQVRIEFEGATYHVMCRGDRHLPNLPKGADEKALVGTADPRRRRYHWRGGDAAKAIERAGHHVATQGELVGL